jgi:hypothetical protein
MDRSKEIVDKVKVPVGARARAKEGGHQGTGFDHNNGKSAGK